MRTLDALREGLTVRLMIGRKTVVGGEGESKFGERQEVDVKKSASQRKHSLKATPPAELAQSGLVQGEKHQALGPLVGSGSSCAVTCALLWLGAPAKSSRFLAAPPRRTLPAQSVGYRRAFWNEVAFQSRRKFAAQMGKAKSSGGVPNRAVYSRLSFLYQASALLATQQEPGVPGQVADATPNIASAARSRSRTDQHIRDGLSRRLLADMRSVSLKTLLRLSPDVKRTVCKFCDSLLVEGKTCVSTVENKSKGGAKPWADVLVIKCQTCSREKRFPIAARRQPRRPERTDVAAQGPADESRASRAERGPD